MRKVEEYKFIKKINYIHKYNILLILVVLFFASQNFSNNSFKNLISFKERYSEYINLKDETFLNKEEIRLINKLKILTKNEKCFQVFTYETAIPYLLKKKSCTKFYHIMNMGTKKNQINFIEELKIKKAKYILTGGTYQSIGMMRGRENFEPELTPEQRFPYINNFILNNYNLYESINKWKILILK